MKFIHAADIHLDSVYSGLRSFYAAKSFSIAKASQEAFIRLIDFALEQKVDFILLAGDLFDRNWKDYQQGLFLLEQIKRFDRPIFSIRGNHDAENRLLKKIPYPSNFYEFSSTDPETKILEPFKVALHGQSYFSVEMKEDLSLNYPKAMESYFNIGVLHSSGEQGHSEKSYSPFILKKLLEKRYDYWALGHLHTHHFLSKDPPVVYSGILQGRHMKETGPKGCCLVEVENQTLKSIDFHELSDLLFLKVEIELSELLSEQDLKKKLFNELEQALQAYPKHYRFILRFIFKGRCELKPSFHEDLPHYEHTIHCWLEENDSGRLILERIENLTLSARAEADFVFFKDLKLELRELLKSKECKQDYLSTLKALFESAPLSYKNHPMWAELEEKERFQSLVKKAELNLIERLLETSYEVM